jgi:hypothetical protein
MLIYPIFSWFHVWFLIPILLIVIFLVHTIKILTDKIVIEKGFIEIGNVFYVERIFYSEIDKILKPRTKENTSKFYLVVLKNNERKKIRISFFRCKSNELYNIFNVITENNNCGHEYKLENFANKRDIIINI